MSLRFELAYLFGYVPWDRWQDKTIERLRTFVEGPQAPKVGRVLDLGCGTGRATVYLAQRGWQATGVDTVERALRRARRRADSAGVKVEFVRGDVTRLDQAGIHGPFDLFLDLGCFHVLSDEERRRYGESVTRVASEDAQLILFAFGPNSFLAGPRGAEQGEIERCLAPNWTIVRSAPVEKLPYRIPPSASATWYMLRCAGGSGARSSACGRCN